MEQKRRFITGISSGLGQALAQAMLEKDALVLGTFRQQQQANAFNAPANAFAYALDLTKSEQINEVAQQVINRFGRIDVLVNNAEMGFAGAISDQLCGSWLWPGPHDSRRVRAYRRAISWANRSH